MATGPQLQPGLRVGNYILQSKIGEGAFSVVWTATHYERQDRVVAIKIATDPAFRRQLGREARLPEINHRNVVSILDSDTRFADFPYVVMPLYMGGSLADLIAEHPTGLPLSRVNWALVKILDGLSAAHNAGIVHRDLKPSNILLDEVSGEPVVADFGLCVVQQTSEIMRSMAQSISLERDSAHGIAGTLAYMAPEIRDGSAATPAADVFSVGVLLFEMLTGRRPCGPERPNELRRASELRSDLDAEGSWDRLYSEACSSLPNRIPDAKRMLRRYLELFPEAHERAEFAAEAHLLAYAVKKIPIAIVETYLAETKSKLSRIKLTEWIAENHPALVDGIGDTQVLMYFWHHIGNMYEAAGDPTNAANAFLEAHLIGRQHPENQVGVVLSAMIEASIAPYSAALREYSKKQADTAKSVSPPVRANPGAQVSTKIQERQGSEEDEGDEEEQKDVDAPELRQDQLVFVQMSVEPKSVHVTESFTAALVIGIRKFEMDGRLVELGNLLQLVDGGGSDLSVFGTRFTSSEVTLTDSGGVRHPYVAYRQTREIRAEQVGAMQVGPVFFKVNYPISLRRSSQGGMEVAHSRKETARADAITVEVKGLPDTAERGPGRTVAARIGDAPDKVASKRDDEPGAGVSFRIAMILSVAWGVGILLAWLLGCFKG